MIRKDFSPTAQNDKGEITQNDKAHTCHTQALPPCHTEPLGEVSNSTCHTERREVSHNTESKRDFSHSLKMTKGKQLKMTTAYKPSGIEWLGEIPQSWEIVKIKQVSKVVTGKTPCLENEWGNEMPFITPTDCFFGYKIYFIITKKVI